MSTFTGSVFVLKEKGQNQAEKVRLAKRRESLSQVQALEQTIRDLEDRLEQEKARYFEATDGRKGSNPVSALPIFNSTDSFLLQEDGSHLLSLEMEVAIDVVIIQCDIPIDVLDTEKNSAVVSFTKSNGSEVLATFRCQSSTTSLSVRIRSVEGQSGLLRAYVIFKMNPKSCLLRTFEIKPLSLHKRCHKSAINGSEDLNTLEINGYFSLIQCHSWLQSCLPEFPEKLPTNKSESGSDKLFKFDFVSTLEESGLDCTFKKGTIKFESNNISTISILKDFITRLATNSSIKVEVSTEIRARSIFATLRSLFPIVKRLVREKEVARLRNAILTEIMPSDSVIGQEMLDDLNLEAGEDVQIDLSFDRVVGLIVDLFIDYHKLKGSASKSTLNEIRGRIPDLITVLDSTIIDGVVIDVDEFVLRMTEFWGMKVD